jgi:hypothetical protein
MGSSIYPISFLFSQMGTWQVWTIFLVLLSMMSISSGRQAVGDGFYSAVHDALCLHCGD